MKKIVVIGSLNQDTVIETSKMPEKGETVHGKDILLVPGGKGANQAYAAGKLGGRVQMVGAVGDDAPGRTLVENLESVGVDVSCVARLPGIPTGQAFIMVDENGENSITLIAGSNAHVSEAMIQQHISCIEDADIVILQLEIPFKTVEYVKNLAVSLRKTVIVDPAPAIAGLPDSFWAGIDYIKPNETELSILVNRPLKHLDDVKCAARHMLEKGVKGILVTLGGDGCLLATSEKEEYFPAYKVNAVDTTAAGDSFTAAFALALSMGKSCEEAVRFGQKVSSIAVTRKGAQTSIPTLEEVLSKEAL